MDPTCSSVAARSLVSPHRSFSTFSFPRSLARRNKTPTQRFLLLRGFCHPSAAVTITPASSQTSSSTPLNLVSSDHCPLRIAIIGFGNYGQFLAKAFVAQGHAVSACSRTDHSFDARLLGVSFFLDPRDIVEQHPDVILLSTSIISSVEVLKSFPWQRLERNALFVDVLSVKEFPKSLLLNTLPHNFDIVCSHPMFGPQSAKHGWINFNFVYERVRIGIEKPRVQRCERFLNIFAREGCKMLEMSCEEHDKYAAGSQFITHTVGRILGMLKLESTPINTRGFESLLDLVQNTVMDSFDLYYGLFMYNKNSVEMLERLDLAFEALRKQLFERLHGALRKRLFRNRDRDPFLQGKYISTPPCGASQTSALCVSRFPDLKRPLKCSAPIADSIYDSSKLKIAIVGFGNFGQFIAKTLIRQGHRVLAYSRNNYSDTAHELGACYTSHADDLCESHPEVILLCTSILSTESVLNALPIQRLKRSTLFVDVLSVKEFPRNLLLQRLPPCFDILCTHPMFGPESGKNRWNNLPFVFDKVRIGDGEERKLRANKFLDIFTQEGCKMIEMPCAEHDRHAAGSQFITHTVGRILEKLHLEPTPINTKGYETLLNLVENTAGDSFDLYYGLFMYNENALEQLERLYLAFESLKKQLVSRLHEDSRKQMFEKHGSSQNEMRENPSALSSSQKTSF